MKYFGVFDFLSSYFKIPLSQFLTYFLLDTGLYYYTKCGSGMSSSGDHFLKVSNEIVLGCKNLLKLIDDVVIYASTLEELLKYSREFLERCKANNVMISKSKFHISNQVKFAGQIIDEFGVRLNPDRLLAIPALKPPTGIPSVRSYLGMVNQLQNYILELAQLTEPIRSLLRRDTKFQWLPQQDLAFHKIKEILTSDLPVGYYDIKLTTYICFK